jgi:exonuclease SbcD
MRLLNIFACSCAFPTHEFPDIILNSKYTTFSMKVLHTSDWHLGQSLHNRKRYDEFESFLNWLKAFIGQEKIDMLIVAGDIFDSSTPSNRAQELYYGFLAGIRDSGCRHVVITGGNHDSPTFLDAPKHLLGALHIKVIGAITDKPEDELYFARDTKGNLEAIVCAVPFLRDRDIRTVEAGEIPEDKVRKLRENIAAHYREVAALAITHQDNTRKVPVIGTGHLFTQHARTTEGDGVRELYVGTAAHVDANDISAGFDYLALGHLHQAQTAGNNEFVRYSGSPVPMGFAEAGQQKKIVVVEFGNTPSSIQEYDIPCFQELVRLTGDLESLCNRMIDMKNKESTAWLEIEVNSVMDAAAITAQLDGIIENSGMKILRIRNKNVTARALASAGTHETLENLNDRDVFMRCLEANEIEAEERDNLLAAYDEAIGAMQSADTNKE